jgi:hypothetical protein
LVSSRFLTKIAKKRQNQDKKNVSLKQPETFRHIFMILALTPAPSAYFRGWPGTVSGRKKNHGYATEKIVGAPAAGGGPGRM